MPGHPPLAGAVTREIQPMSAKRIARPPRRRVEAEPEAALQEMEQATQRLRDQAWKINAVTRTPLIPEETVRPAAGAEPASAEQPS